MEKKEVESYTMIHFVCPYCETTFEGDEVSAEECRDECFEKLQKENNTTKG